MPNKFLSLSFYEYLLLCNKHNLDKVEAWQHTRLITYTIYCMNSTEKKKPTLQEWHPLITDVKPEAEKPATPEEQQEIIRRASENIRLLNRK